MPQSQTLRRDLLASGHWFGFESDIKGSWVEVRENRLQWHPASLSVRCEGHTYFFIPGIKYSPRW